MALFTRDELISRARDEVLTKSASAILEKEAKAFSGDKSFDIFMSHSSLDAKEILGLKLQINDMGYSVYVDWIEDPQLDRSKVTKETAGYIQSRMRRSKSLFYAISANAQGSIWMPWELGYFDGLDGKVAILPVRQDNAQTSAYQGQEYLGLYPYIDKAKPQGKPQPTLWIHTDPKTYILFDYFLQGKKPHKH